MHSSWMGSALGLGLMLLGACRGSADPTQELVRAHSSIRAAEAVGAGAHPAASMYLERARGHLERAEAHRARGQREEARWALERAEVDAELALSLTRVEVEADAAREAEARIQALRSELE